MSNLGLMSSRAKDNFWAPSSDMAAQRAPDLTPPPPCAHFAVTVCCQGPHSVQSGGDEHAEAAPRCWNPTDSADGLLFQSPAGPALLLGKGRQDG